MSLFGKKEDKKEVIEEAEFAVAKVEESQLAELSAYDSFKERGIELFAKYENLIVTAETLVEAKKARQELREFRFDVQHQEKDINKILNRFKSENKEKAKNEIDPRKVIEDRIHTEINIIEEERREEIKRKKKERDDKIQGLKKRIADFRTQMMSTIARIKTISEIDVLEISVETIDFKEFTDINKEFNFVLLEIDRAKAERKNILIQERDNAIKAEELKKQEEDLAKAKKLQEEENARVEARAKELQEKEEQLERDRQALEVIPEMTADEMSLDQIIDTAKKVFIKNFGLKSVKATEFSKQVGKLSKDFPGNQGSFTEEEIFELCEKVFEPYNDPKNQEEIYKGKDLEAVGVEPGVTELTDVDVHSVTIHTDEKRDDLSPVEDALNAKAEQDLISEEVAKANGFDTRTDTEEKIDKLISMINKPVVSFMIAEKDENLKNIISEEFNNFKKKIRERGINESFNLN